MSFYFSLSVSRQHLARPSPRPLMAQNVQTIAISYVPASALFTSTCLPRTPSTRLAEDRSMTLLQSKSNNSLYTESMIFALLSAPTRCDEGPTPDTRSMIPLPKLHKNAAPNAVESVVTHAPIVNVSPCVISSSVFFTISCKCARCLFVVILSSLNWRSAVAVLRLLRIFVHLRDDLTMHTFQDTALWLRI